MMWLCVHLPELGLELFHREAEDPGCPQVLVEDNRVVLANEPARRLNVTPGTTLATAHAIVSDLVHVVRDPDREAARLRFLAECCYRFSSEVSVHPPGNLLLEVERSCRLFGGIDALRGQVATLARDTGHRVELGLSRTPMAALALARARAGCPDVRDIRQVPLSCCELEAAQMQALGDMGIHTLGALLALPSGELAMRFGKALNLYLDRLTGGTAHPLPLITPSPDYADRLNLLEPVRSKQALAPLMKRLLAELERWLVGRQLGCDRLLWRFSSHTCDSRVTMPVSFARPLQNARRFHTVSELKLADLSLPDDVLTVVLEARQLSPWQNDSGTLFGPTAEHSGPPAALDDLLDRLTARLSAGAVTGIQGADDHRPEHACAGRPPQVRLTAPGRERDPAPACSRSPGRPLWLLEHPHPVTRRRLQLLQGPERIRTGWWQDAVWRDYYVARDLGGSAGRARCWVFVTADDRWFVHGFFG